MPLSSDKQKHLQLKEREAFGAGGRAEQANILGAIDYLDLTPKPFVVQVSLVEYFERIKRHRADRWQKDFCGRLQSSAENRHLAREWVIYHAEAQLGKTSILSQAFPAWLLGHDPLFRYALMMYNKTRSEMQSDTVITIMQSPIHRAIFPNKDGWLESEQPSKSAWSTKARKELNDGQDSFNPVGLQSGLTGSGFDWLTIDDPYANEQEAFSTTANLNMRNKFEYTVMSRVSPYSNVVGMFHRYAPDDFAGYLLDTGDFDYVRYASQFDGDFIHDETGKRFGDPLNREIGEFISPERRPPSYYAKVKKNNRVWLSMFQGRPSSEEGDFFNVGKLNPLSVAETIVRRQECVVMVRAWDLAATEAGGDYSVGVLMGMRSDGRATVFDIEREQLDTAGRDELQLKTAKKDGAGVVITIPADVGAAGKSTVFHTKQLLKGYEVVERSVSGKKTDRARNFAGAVNSGDVDLTDDSFLPEDRQWVKQMKKEMRDFPLSEYDDIVDAAGDGYNECYERKVKGLIITNYKPQRSVIGYNRFYRKFPNAQKRFQTPAAFHVYVGIKITTEASRPNSAVIVARASENSGLPETLFVIGEYKEYTNNFYLLFDWLTNQLKAKCDLLERKDVRIYVHPESGSYLPTIRQKLNFAVTAFDHDEMAGITETNWYLLPRDTAHPFQLGEKSTGLFLVVPDVPQNNQLSVAADADGLVGLRQEFSTWGYNDKGEPSAVGQVADCLRMVNYAFRTVAAGLTTREMIEKRIGEKNPELTMAKLKERSPYAKGFTPGQTAAWREAESRARKEMELPNEDLDYLNGRSDGDDGGFGFGGY